MYVDVWYDRQLMDIEYGYVLAVCVCVCELERRVRMCCELLYANIG